MKHFRLLRYGFTAGTLSILYVGLTGPFIYRTSWGMYLGYLAIVILPVMMYLALRSSKMHEGHFGFAGTLWRGLLVAFVAALTYCAYAYIDTHWMGSRHLKATYEAAAEGMRAEGKSEADIAAEVRNMNGRYDTLVPYRNTLIWYMALGLVYTTPIFLILKCKRHTP